MRNIKSKLLAASLLAIMATGMCHAKSSGSKPVPSGQIAQFKLENNGTASNMNIDIMGFPGKKTKSYFMNMANNYIQQGPMNAFASTTSVNGNGSLKNFRFMIDLYKAGHQVGKVAVAPGEYQLCYYSPAKESFKERYRQKDNAKMGYLLKEGDEGYRALCQ